MMFGFYDKANLGGLNEDDLANIKHLTATNPDLMPPSRAASLIDRDRTAKQKVKNDTSEREFREVTQARATALAIAGNVGEIKEETVTIGGKTITLTAKAQQQRAADDVWARYTQIYSTPQEQIEAFSATGLSYMPDVLKRQATAATNQLMGHAAKLELGEVDKPGEKDTTEYFGKNVTEFYSWFRSASEGGSATTLRRLFDNQAEFDIYQDSLLAEQYGGVTEATALLNSFTIHSKQQGNREATTIPFTEENTTNVMEKIDGYKVGSTINDVVARGAIRLLAYRAYMTGVPPNSLEDTVVKKLEGRYAIINDAFVPTNGNQINPAILAALNYKLETWSEKNKSDIGDSKMTFVPVIDKPDQWMIVSADTLDQKSSSRFIFGRDEMLAEYEAHRLELLVLKGENRRYQAKQYEDLTGGREGTKGRYSGQVDEQIDLAKDPDSKRNVPVPRSRPTPEEEAENAKRESRGGPGMLKRFKEDAENMRQGLGGPPKLDPPFPKDPRSRGAR